MIKPERHVWDEGSTHRAVAGKEYDEVWDYAEQLKEENAALKRELRLERKTQLGALLDSGAISLVQWEEGMEQLALLADTLEGK